MTLFFEINTKEQVEEIIRLRTIDKLCSYKDISFTYLSDHISFPFILKIKENRWSWSSLIESAMENTDFTTIEVLTNPEKYPEYYI